MNVCTLSGNLTNDLELVNIGEGRVIAKGSLAVNDFSSKKQDTDFIRFEVFGDRGAYLAEKTGKGNKISITGKLKISKYEDKAGVKRESSFIRVSDYEIHTWRNEKEEQDIYKDVDVDFNNI